MANRKNGNNHGTRIDSPLTSYGLNDANIPDILKVPNVLTSPSVLHAPTKQVAKAKHGILDGPNTLAEPTNFTNPYLK